MYPIVDKERTGKRLEILMKVNKMTPKDIQNYLSLSCVQTVYRWFEGINIPSIDNLYALSQLFHLTIDDIVVGNRRSVKYGTGLPQGKRLLMYSLKLEQMAVA